MDPLAELFGESAGIVAVREKLQQLLLRQSGVRRLPPILIQGETGAGKGLLARTIHRAGPRRDGPFVDVNCAAIPDTLLEAEMFGFERGAFTDARQAKAGLFHAAHQGTLFLDEVGLLPEGLQAKLLKVIEERTVRRLGSTRNEPIDVAILTATSEDLLAATRARRFREDLYHRLAVLTLWLPPLRERGPDIVGLAERFLARACADYGLAPKTLTPEARGALLAHAWPGNVRELSNVMERVALLADGPLVTAATLGISEEARVTPSAAARVVATGSAGGADSEREQLLEALGRAGWNISRAAAELGLSRNTIRYRIEKHGLRLGQRSSPRTARTEPASAGPGEAPAPAAAVEAMVETARPAGLRWERRRLTLLRAVVLAASAPSPWPEVGRAPETLTDKVQSFGGRVEELSPTAITAAFGIEPVEDAPRRAALSAIAIQRAAERARSHSGEAIRVKIGIHSGPFLLAQLGEAVMIDQEAKQIAGGLLEELVASAEPGTVAVSAAAASLLERRFDLVPLGRAERPAGETYRLGGPERAGLGLGGRMARFVGRWQELELLRSRLASATMGQGQIVGVVGEAGIGKSRLLHEFRQGLPGDRVTYLEGRCVSFGQAIPYLPVLGIVRSACGIGEADSAEAISEKVHAALRDVGMDAAACGPYLLHLLGVEGADAHAGSSPEAVRQRTFEVLRRMSVRASRQRPMVMAIEDLHWSDGASEEYVALLAEAVAGARILLVTTHRPGYRAPWGDKSYTTQVALQPLAPEDSRSIVRAFLETDRVADSLVDALLSKGEGNPFFLEELARAVMEQGDLSPTPAVPDTIQEVLLARIDRLPPEDKRLLQFAALIGKDVAFPVLQGIVELPESALREALGRLQAGEFLYETSRGPEPEYTFKHALTHEVAYASLLEDRRRVVHARIADAIEQLYPDRLVEQVERLADHSFRGEAWDKALAYLRQAGAKAAARSANREAVAWLDRALTALSHLPQSRDLLEQAVDIRFGLRASMLPLGEFGKILDRLREAEALAATMEDQPRLGWVCAYLTDYFRQVGDHAGAIDSGQRALAIAQSLGNFALEVATRTYLGQVYHDAGDFRRASEFFRRNVEALGGELSAERLGLPYLPAVHSRAWLAFCLAELGEFAEGIRLAEEGFQMAEAADHPFSLTSACAGLGRAYLCRGDLGRALPVLERGVELSRVWNIRLWFPLLASALGSGYALAGRVAEALSLLEAAVRQHASIRGMAAQSIRITSLGHAYLLANRANDAASLAGRALELARHYQERANEAYALRLLGEVASRAAPLDADRAEACYREARALAEMLGLSPLTAHCDLGLGKLARERGNRATAETHLTAATALFREMDMRLWLPEAEDELARLG